MPRRSEEERASIRERAQQTKQRIAQREAEEAAKAAQTQDSQRESEPKADIDFETQSPNSEPLDVATTDLDCEQPLIVTPMMRREFKELVRRTLKHTAQAMGIRICEFQHACHFSLEQWAKELGVTTRMITLAGAQLRASELFKLNPGGGAGWANRWQPRFELVAPNATNTAKTHGNNLETAERNIDPVVSRFGSNLETGFGLGRPTSSSSIEEESVVCATQRTHTREEHARDLTRARSASGVKGRGRSDPDLSRRLLLGWSPVTQGVIPGDRVDFVARMKEIIPAKWTPSIKLDPFQIRRLTRFRAYQLSFDKRFRTYSQIDYAYLSYLTMEVDRCIQREQQQARKRVHAAARRQRRQMEKEFSL